MYNKNKRNRLCAACAGADDRELRSLCMPSQCRHACSADRREYHSLELHDGTDSSTH